MQYKVFTGIYLAALWVTAAADIDKFRQDCANYLGLLDATDSSFRDYIQFAATATDTSIGGDIFPYLTNGQTLSGTVPTSVNSKVFPQQWQPLYFSVYSRIAGLASSDDILTNGVHVFITDGLPLEAGASDTGGSFDPTAIASDNFGNGAAATSTADDPSDTDENSATITSSATIPTATSTKSTEPTGSSNPISQTSTGQPSSSSKAGAAAPTAVYALGTMAAAIAGLAVLL